MISSEPMIADQKQTLHILMVEDDKYYFEYVRQLLLRRTKPRFELCWANSLQAAAEYLQEHETPDAILLDLNLPDGQGLLSLGKLKENSDNCPIIILTGSTDDSLGLRAVSLGAHDYLVKQSLGNDSLVRCIRYAIERRRSEEQSQRLAAIQDFVATLAHDLKIPMIGANKLFDALLAGNAGELTPAQTTLMLALKESNANQLVLVQRLLEIYRYEVGTADPSFVAIDLPNFTEKLIATAFADSNVKIRLDDRLPDKKRIIRGDEEAMDRLLKNLISNAITYSPPGQPITITLSAHVGKISIAVHNHGEPIPREIRNNLFQKFWHGVPGKRYVAHTGLGLYLCQRIVELHRGRILCHSTAEEGTIITVVLPSGSKN
ncbi:MAG: hybrid sensor histidine kinase/response regulator [Cyanobacteria bacterium REEB67]|nr:hybrid sensor histidine kinase/response regulator [Cyanobacteria bacterium REEB67]